MTNLLTFRSVPCGNQVTLHWVILFCITHFKVFFTCNLLNIQISLTSSVTANNQAHTCIMYIYSFAKKKDSFEHFSCLYKIYSYIF